MNDLEFCTPPDVPRQVGEFDSGAGQLAAGNAGKNGRLALVFRVGSGGRTVVGEQFSQAPLHVQRALYCEGAAPYLAYLYIASSSGGILQGDRHRIDITMKKDSMAHITTQGATRIYGMDSGNATQMVNITLEQGAYLEFVPDQIIPYKNSRFYQRTSLKVGAGATAVCSEVVAPGRSAMGESFEYDVCYLKTQAAGPDGRPGFMDVASMEPKKRSVSSFGVMGEHSMVGSVYVLTEKRNIQGLYEGINGIIAGAGGVSGGASSMWNDAGLLVRMLGDDTGAIKEAVFGIVGLVRKTCIGAPLSRIRKS